MVVLQNVQWIIKTTVICCLNFIPRENPTSSNPCFPFLNQTVSAYRTKWLGLLQVVSAYTVTPEKKPQTILMVIKLGRVKTNHYGYRGGHHILSVLGRELRWFFFPKWKTSFKTLSGVFLLPWYSECLKGELTAGHTIILIWKVLKAQPLKPQYIIYDDYMTHKGEIMNCTSEG